MFRVPKHGECEEMVVLLTMKKENISTVIYFAALMPLSKKQEGVQAECSENSRGIHYATIIFNGLLR
jgi:hypothetical protein